MAVDSVQKSKTDANKRRRAAKWDSNRERWANDKSYLAKQKEEGYERIGNKWIKTVKKDA